MLLLTVNEDAPLFPLVVPWDPCPLIPVMSAYDKHAQMEQEGDFCCPSFLEYARQLGSGLRLQCL